MPSPAVVEGLPQAAEGTSSYGSRFFFFNALVTTASIAIQTASEQSVNTAGLLVGDHLVSVNKGDGVTLTLGVVYGRISAASVLKLTLLNATSTAQVAGSSTQYTFLIYRPSI